KAASDVYAPVAGTVAAVNDEVAKAPEKVNTDAYSAWLFRLRPEQATAADALLDARGYQSVIAED
ncbi:MAG TPA: glycine cleavage system protein H, partial [Casimicrobiaceae bacterium]